MFYAVSYIFFIFYHIVIGGGTVGVEKRGKVGERRTGILQFVYKKVWNFI